MTTPMPKTVLICDDEPVLRSLMRAVLSSDYALLEAANGDEAVEQADLHRPDLILLDMMMPGRTGHEVLDALAEDDELDRTPVLVLTGRPGDERAGAPTRAGTLRFLPKPFSPTELALVVGELLAQPA